MNTQTNEINTLTGLLFHEYKKLLLTTQETSTIIDRSVVSLERDRYKATGIPYTKLGNGGSSKALYNINDIAKYVISRKMRVL